MRVLIACEFSGVVRDAFAAKGHDAWSCDVVPARRHAQVQHIMADVLTVLNDGWDLMVAFPPCTHLANAGCAWFAKKRANGQQQDAIDFFLSIANAPIERIAIENPVGIMSSEWRKPDQIIQPWQFGHEANKPTCLWLKNLERLIPTKVVGRGQFYRRKSGKRDSRWLNDTGSSVDQAIRARRKSITFPGIAQAMAEQWGNTTTTERAATA